MAKSSAEATLRLTPTVIYTRVADLEAYSLPPLLKYVAPIVEHAEFLDDQIYLCVAFANPTSIKR